MTSDEVKQLKTLLKAEIDPLKTDVGLLQDDLKLVKGQLSEVNDKLDTHTTSLVVIEDTLKGYADMYKVNKDKIEELNQRVDSVEEQIGMAPQK